MFYCSECHGPWYVPPSWGTWLEQKPGGCLSTALWPKLYSCGRFFAFDIHSIFTKPFLDSCRALKFLLLLSQVAWSSSTSLTTGSPPSGSFSSSLDLLDLLHLHLLLRRVQLRRLPKLTVLNLSNNLIASVNPNTFPKNSQLRTLNLASNSIEVSSSKRCPDEKQLIIERKKTRSYSLFVQILEAGCLDQLSKLEELKLSRNRLSSLPKMVTIFSLLQPSSSSLSTFLLAQCHP